MEKVKRDFVVLDFSYTGLATLGSGYRPAVMFAPDLGAWAIDPKKSDVAGKAVPLAPQYRTSLETMYHELSKSAEIGTLIIRHKGHVPSIKKVVQEMRSRRVA